MDDQDPAFGARLRAHRERAGLTQEALAERAGLAASAVAALERGRRRRPYPDTVRRLAEALALTADERAAFAAAPARRLDSGVDHAHPTLTTARPARLAAPAPSNLRAAPADLFGRDRDVGGLCELIAAPRAVRLVTLTGVGGVGKTRLALAAGEALRDRFAGGVWLVELVPLRDPDLLPQAVAAALNVPEVPGVPPLDRLAGALASRRLLLVLDNCEHLIDASAALVARLLADCPGVVVLATSREPLQLSAERRWRVLPLPAPDAATPPVPAQLLRNPAVQLFVGRAQSVAATFGLTEENAAAVGDVCHRLDGIPLALELAAARVGVLTVAQIRERLEDSLRLLAGRSRSFPPRHQTLQATLDWSYALLSAAERALFRRLAVFAGTFDLDAAEAVCGGPDLPTNDVLDLLNQVVDSRSSRWSREATRRAIGCWSRCASTPRRC